MFQALLDALKKYADEGTAPSSGEAAQFANELRRHEKTQPLFQEVFNRGHAKATEDGKENVSTVEKELAAEKRRADKAEKALEKLKDSQPDLKQLEEQYQERVTELEQEVEAQKGKLAQERLDFHTNGAVAKVVNQLVDQGVDREWATYLMTKPENRSRLKAAAGEDGEVTVSVLQAGKTIPVQADNPFEAIAAELRKDVKPQFITGKVKGGSGASGDGGGTGSVYDRIRKEAQEKKEVERPDDFKTAAERLGAR